ncbi:MAG: hypothetical protein AAGF57_17095 [Pseudomonadota bacterium]
MNVRSRVFTVFFPATLLCAMLALVEGALAEEEPLIRRLTQQFEDSDIIFQRSQTNAPFIPLAFFGATAYGDAEVEGTRFGDVDYSVSTVSQAAGLPILLSDRDALVVGEYVSWSEFDVDGAQNENFSVGSVGVPVGWLRQVNDAWQSVAFVMPLGHRDNLKGSDWSWQTLGGMFARYTQHDRLWWAFGFYADVAPGEDFYIPYVGASWAIDERWTISAIMPWPGIIFAPSENWFLRLGVSPSGASWSFNPQGGGDTTVNLDAWDFGLSIERRVYKNVWFSAEAGVGGFRGLRLDGTDVESPELDVSTSPFVGINLNFRPSLN